MIFLGSFAIILAIAYIYLQFKYMQGWSDTPVFASNAPYPPTIFFSILIPARNEAGNIADLLSDLSAQDYPRDLYEIIVINDHSSDKTRDEVIGFKSVRLIDLETGAGKKAAIELGISKAHGNYIVTFDADVRIKTTHLQTLSRYIEETGSDAVAMPVLINDYENNAFFRFQALDMAGMMLITAGAMKTGLFHMCNGANFCYKKDAFLQVGGFSGNEHIASGDDVFLIQKIAANKTMKVGFLKSNASVAVTQPSESVKSFFHQRLRWASKTGSYSDKKIDIQHGVVFLYCVNILLLLLFSIILFLQYIFYLFLITIIIKIIVDFILLKQSTSFFYLRHLLRYYIVSQLIHIMYIVMIGLGIFFEKENKWRERKI